MPIIVPEARIYECDVCQRFTEPLEAPPEDWVISGAQCYCPVHSSEGITEIEHKMSELIVKWDHEEAHAEADTLLCNLLVFLGYGKIVEDFNKIKKLYA